MALYVPIYYSDFRCVAGACKHTCCAGWQIDIDADTASRYQEMEGAIGEEIRASLLPHEGGVHFATLKNGRCAHLDEAGLCRIISAAGEGALCHICREHPRFYSTVSGDTLVGLGAVCETAAELLLTAPDYVTLVSPDAALPPVSLTDAAFCAHAALFDALKNGEGAFDARVADIRERFADGLYLPPREWRRLFASLEYLDKKNKKRFQKALRRVARAKNLLQQQEPLRERFLAYLFYRHVLSAKDAHDARLAVGVALTMLTVFEALLLQGVSPAEAARTVSEELEYSEENTEAIFFALDLQLL